MTTTIPTWIENFRVVGNGNRSVKVHGSVINTPFGPVAIESKTFDEIDDASFILLQLNFEIERILFQVKLNNIDKDSGRLFKHRYAGLQAEFVYAKLDSSNNAVDVDGSPIYLSSGPDYEISYITIARISLLNQLKEDERKKIQIFQNEKISIPFFVNYYGVGQYD